MTYTPPPAALSLLRANLGYFDSIIPTALEEYLISLLSVSEEALREDCQINLDPDSLYDTNLIVMYAAWLYRKAVTGEGKPLMLSSAIRNRQTGRALEDTT